MTYICIKDTQLSQDSIDAGIKASISLIINNCYVYRRYYTRSME